MWRVKDQIEQLDLAVIDSDGSDCHRAGGKPQSVDFTLQESFYGQPRSH